MKTFMFISYEHTLHLRVVSLWENNQCRGEFRIYGVFDSGTPCDMSISVHPSVQGNGYSRIMIARMMDEIRKEGVRSDQWLCIDVDASEGFWDRVGMKRNRFGLDYRGRRKMECKGYEKVITVRDMEKAFSKIQQVGIPQNLIDLNASKLASK